MNKERKFKITVAVLIVGTLMCVVPKMFDKEVLSGTEWISLVSLLGGGYFLANVAEKKKVGEKDNV